MLQLKSRILNFFLLVIENLLDFSLDIGYKNGGSFEILLEKSLEFVLNRRNGTIIFNFSLVLLLIKVDPISEKQSCKKNTLGACSIGCIKIIFAQSKKVIALHIRAIIV